MKKSIKRIAALGLMVLMVAGTYVAHRNAKFKQFTDMGNLEALTDLESEIQDENCDPLPRETCFAYVVIGGEVDENHYYEFDNMKIKERR